MNTITSRILAAVTLGTVALGAASASAAPPPAENTYPMHLVFNVNAKGKQTQLNAGISRIEFGRAGSAWTMTISAKQMDGAPLSIPNYTPMCKVTGDREDVIALYDRVHARLKGGGEVICTGSTSGVATTTVDLKAGQGWVTILETP